MNPSRKKPEQNNPPLSPAMQNLGKELLTQHSSIAKGILHKEELFKGPLPPPEYVKQYKDLGVWELVGKLAINSDERQNQLVAAKIRASDWEISKGEKLLHQSKVKMFSQIILSYLGFFLAGGCIAVSIWFAFIGKNGWAATFFITGVLPAFSRYLSIPFKNQ